MINSELRQLLIEVEQSMEDAIAWSMENSLPKNPESIRRLRRKAKELTAYREANEGEEVEVNFDPESLKTVSTISEITGLSIEEIIVAALTNIFITATIEKRQRQNMGNLPQCEDCESRTIEANKDDNVMFVCHEEKCYK